MVIRNRSFINYEFVLYFLRVFLLRLMINLAYYRTSDLEDRNHFLLPEGSFLNYGNY